MEIFVKEYLNKQGIKTVEGLAQHIIELKRNTIVPDIVFDLVDVLVNKKDCLLSFFAENKDNNKMIKREVNSHLSDAINSRLQLSKKINEESLEKYKSLFKHIDPTQYNTLDLGQIKGSSTRHKSQNGETHKDITIEEKLKIAEDLKKEVLKQLNITLDNIKTQSSKSYYTSPEKKEEIKADWIDFIGCGLKRGRIINYENSAEKGENSVFQKDSEIHKEDNVDLIMAEALHRLGKKHLEDKNHETFIVGEGVKESQTVEKAPIFTYCKVNKNAIEALSLRALHGHIKYEKPNDWENFTRVPNADFEYSNSQFRHALDIGEEDEETHLIASAWNAVARLELYLRNKVK